MDALQGSPALSVDRGPALVVVLDFPAVGGNVEPISLEYVGDLTKGLRFRRRRGGQEGEAQAEGERQGQDALFLAWFLLFELRVGGERPPPALWATSPARGEVFFVGGWEKCIAPPVRGSCQPQAD